MILIGVAMDGKSVPKIVFQKKRSKRRLDKRAGTQNNKQIDFGRINQVQEALMPIKTYYTLN